MNKELNSEKNPLDELFARRLGKLEQPPSPDSFARLQQRMQGGQEQPRLVIWRNPNVQMAAAACVAAVLLFGWLYSSNQSSTPLPGGTSTVAVQEQSAREARRQAGQQDEVQPDKIPAQVLAHTEPTTAQKADKQRAATHAIGGHTQHDFGQKTQLATVKPAVSSQKQQTVDGEQIGKSKNAPEQLASVPTAPAAQKLATERVLVVTIEEPEALVAARQTAASVVNKMPVLAASPSKEGKATFWQQVKRLKQDDDVARQETPTDDSGLLSRAYKGIKQRLEKDKSAKQ